MDKKHTANKVSDTDYLIQKKVPKDLQPKFDQWRELRNLPLGKEARSEVGNIILDIILNETSLLDQQLIKKLDNIFLEGTYKEKLSFIVTNFLKFHEKFPYLTTQRTITPEDAEFPPCPFVKAIYWEGEFLGFHCRANKTPINLPRLKVGKLSLKIVTSEDCWDCIQLCKKQKIGLGIFEHITLKDIELHKEQIRLRKSLIPKSEDERRISEKLENAGIRRTVEEVDAIFKYLSYDKEANKWKGISKASKTTGTSRPTIYKLIEIFPDGVRRS